MRDAWLLLSALVLLAAGCRAEPVAARWPQRAMASEQARSASNQVSVSELRKHVENLAKAHQAETPVVSKLDNLPHTRVRSAAYVARAFTDLGLQPISEVSNDDGLEVRNVYVDLPGARQATEQILVMAHHDAWYTGADDDSSGVAVLLEAARVLKDLPRTRTIRLLATDREEQGLIGINRFSKAHRSDQVALVLNMDTIAFARHTDDSQSAPLGFVLPKVADFLLAIANGPAEPALVRFSQLSGELPDGVGVAGVMVPGDSHYPLLNHPLRGDQAPYWKAGVPGLFLTDSADFRSPHYHQASDLPDTLDYDFFQQVARTVIGAVQAFAEVN
jgi:hypothetical protein